MLAPFGQREDEMRLGRIGVLVAAALAWAAPAQAAFELKPSWGYAFIDDKPFHDPASGALLPTTQVFPRGHIRDVPPPDEKDVRITINVFTHGTGSPVAAYKVEEGDFADIPFDRKLDVRPFQVSYVKYDFCRFNPSNGAIEVCEPPLRIGRPVPPPPIPAPVDRDGDGVSEATDCADNNATVWPGGRELPGNGLDDDCVGGDQPARIVAPVKNRWTVIRGRVRVRELRVREAPADAAVEVRCLGKRKRCPFRVRKAAVAANGTANLRRRLPRRLRPGITIEVRITAPNAIGKVVRYPIKRGRIPAGKTLCLPPGAKKPKRC
jgi:hypothetical protein